MRTCSELKKESIKKRQICVSTFTIAPVPEALNDKVITLFFGEDCNAKQMQ